MDDEIDEGMDEALADWQQHKELQADQDALPAHKRDGYAERMFEYADMERKRKRGE